jgi:hypothetical protein
VRLSLLIDANANLLSYHLTRVRAVWCWCSKPTNEWTPSRHLLELEEWWQQRGSHVQTYGSTSEVVNDQPPNCFTSNCTRVTLVAPLSPNIVPETLDLLRGHGVVQQMDVHIKSDRAVASSYKQASHLDTKEGLWYVCNFFVCLERTREQLSALQITQLRRALEVFTVKVSHARLLRRANRVFFRWSGATRYRFQLQRA